jgi:integrase
MLPRYGANNLGGITTQDVRRFVTEATDGGASTKTVNNVLVLFKGMLADAVEDRFISTNPADVVKRLKWRRPEMSFLTTAQVQKFLETTRACVMLGKVPAKRQEFFTVAFTTGLRLGELLGLQWGDIDFDAGFVHVRRSLYQSEYVDPKSEHSVRKVVLIPEAREAMLSLRERLNPERGAPVFWDSPRVDRILRADLEKILDEAGLPSIRLHDMRHTFASILISLGLSPKFIQKQMGHSSIQVTFDLYGHLFPEAYEEAADKLQAALFPTDRQRIGPRTEAAPSETAESRSRTAFQIPAVP